MIHFASKLDHYTLCRLENDGSIATTIHRRRVSCGACAYRLEHPRTHRDVIAEHAERRGNTFTVWSSP